MLAESSAMNQLCSTFPDQCMLQSAITASKGQQPMVNLCRSWWKITSYCGKSTLRGEHCFTGEGTGGGHSPGEPCTFLFLAGHCEAFSILSVFLSLLPCPHLSFSLLAFPFPFCHSVSHSSFCLFFLIYFPSFTIRVNVFHQPRTRLITVSLELQR